MKLVVRSKYWGRLLEGRTCTPQDDPDRSYRVISSQAVPHNVGDYWGCCPHRGRRVLELNENHFMDHHSGEWNLYNISSDANGECIFNELFLLPENQDCIDVDKHLKCDGWTHVGTITASMARMDLEQLLNPYIKENQSLGRHYHHMHIQILMDEAMDREMPKGGKKADKKKKNKTKNTNPQDLPPNNNKLRTSSDDMIMMEHPNDTIFARPTFPPPPPHLSMPHLAPNDSWTSDGSNSTIATAWNEEYCWAGPPSPHMLLPPIVNGVPYPWQPVPYLPSKLMIPGATWPCDPWSGMPNQCVMIDSMYGGVPHPFPGMPGQFEHVYEGWTPVPNDQNMGDHH